MSARDRAVRHLVKALRRFEESPRNMREVRRDIATALAALEEERHEVEQLRAELATEKALRIEDIEDQIILQRKIDALEEGEDDGVGT